MRLEFTKLLSRVKARAKKPLSREINFHSKGSSLANRLPHACPRARTSNRSSRPSRHVPAPELRACKRIRARAPESLHALEQQIVCARSASPFSLGSESLHSSLFGNHSLLSLWNPFPSLSLETIPFSLSLDPFPFLSLESLPFPLGTIPCLPPASHALAKGTVPVPPAFRRPHRYASRPALQDHEKIREPHEKLSWSHLPPPSPIRQPAGFGNHSLLSLWNPFPASPLRVWPTGSVPVPPAFRHPHRYASRPALHSESAYDTRAAASAALAASSPSALRRCSPPPSAAACRRRRRDVRRPGADGGSAFPPFAGRETVAPGALVPQPGGGHRHDSPLRTGPQAGPRKRR